MEWQRIRLKGCCQLLGKIMKEFNVGDVVEWNIAHDEIHESIIGLSVKHNTHQFIISSSNANLNNYKYNLYGDDRGGFFGFHELKKVEPIFDIHKEFCLKDKHIYLGRCSPQPPTLYDVWMNSVTKEFIPTFIDKHNKHYKCRGSYVNLDFINRQSRNEDWWGLTALKMAKMAKYI